MMFIKKFLSFILSFSLMIFVIFSIYVFNIKSFSSKDMMIQNVQKIDFSLELKKIKNSGNVSGSSKITNNINSIYDIAKEFDVKSEDVDKMMNSKVVKEIVGIPLGNISDFIVNSKNSKIISSDDIYNIINDNIDDAFEIYDIKISEAQKEKLLNRIKLELPDLMKSIPNVDDFLKGKHKKFVDTCQFLFSDTIKIILVILDCVMILILFILERKKGILYVGLSFLLAALLSIGFSFFVPGIFMEIIKDVDLSLLMHSLVKLFVRYVINYSVIVLIVSGIVLLIGQKINKVDNEGSE